MQPIAKVSQTTAMTSGDDIEGRNSMNRKDYKKPTRKQFEIRFPRIHRSIVLRQSGLGPVPRETFIAQIVNDGENGNPLEQLRIYQVCFPEWFHDKLYMRSICGSKKAASKMRHTFNVYYVFNFYAELYGMLMFPAIGVTVLGFSMTSPDTIPPWFPYLGTFFYTIGFPSFCLSVVTFGRNYQYAKNIDDKRLKLIVGLVVFVVCICLPMYGIWATVSYVQQGAAIAVEHTLGLNIGAYIYCALSLPCLTSSMFQAIIFFEVISNCKASVLYIFKFAVMTSLLVGSMTHQIQVGKLVWFPYLGVLGILCVIPLLTSMILLVLFGTTKWTNQNKQREKVALGCAFLLYAGITDGLAWLLAERDFSQPVEVLIDDSLLYTGAIFAYIALIMIWVWVAFRVLESSCRIRE